NSGGGGTSGAQTFTVNNAAATIASTSPSSGVQAQTSLNVTITGTKFAPELAASNVSFGSNITVNSLTFTDSTSLIANITIGSGAATGARNVTVTNTSAATGTGTNVF